MGATSDDFQLIWYIFQAFFSNSAFVKIADSLGRVEKFHGWTGGRIGLKKPL